MAKEKEERTGRGDITDDSNALERNLSLMNGKPYWPKMILGQLKTKNEPNTRVRISFHIHSSEVNDTRDISYFAESVCELGEITLLWSGKWDTV